MEIEKNCFISFESNYESSDIVFLGVPFDGTCTYRPGTRFGPSAVRSASIGLETYSPYLDRNLEELNICDLGDLVLPFGNTKRVLDIISESTKKILRENKKIFSFGGEHLISYPIIKNYIEKYPDLEIIHFDAHTDLREEFLGEELSHANVFRLVYKHIEGKKIHQFGIRSGEKKEFEFAKENLDFNPFNLNNFSEKVNLIKKEAPIYISLDLDILDPSVLPGTGTPEPGGVSFLELMEAIHKLFGRNIVGIDVVELSPHYDHSGVSTIIAAKLVREMMLLFNN